MKSIIKAILKAFGLGIFQIKNHPSIHSANEYNQLSAINAFYSDPLKVQKYINNERIKFFGEIIQVLRSHNLINSNSLIADIGCGTGHFLSLLANHIPENQLYGYEYSDDALKVAHETISKAHLDSLDIYSSQLIETHDIVICTDVIEHLADPEIALSNLYKMVKQERHLLLVVPEGRKDFYDGHINFWSPESWRFFLEKNCPGKIISTGLLNDKKEQYALIKKPAYDNKS